MLVAGVDIVEIPRIKRLVARYGDRFLLRIYTDREISYCRGRAPQLAGRFAAKEAAMKALGTGVKWVRWRDIEVVRDDGKAPTIRLHGSACERAKRLGIVLLTVSLAHSEGNAVAFVVADSQSGNLLPLEE